MIACIAGASSGRARRSTSRSVRSSITGDLKRAREHRFEHGRVEPPRILVVTAAVIAREQDPSVGGNVFGGVAEFGYARLEAERACRGIVRDLAERNNHLHRWQLRQRLLEEWAAGGDLGRLGLVLWRQAFDRIENDCPGQPQPIVAIGGVMAGAQPEAIERRVEEVSCKIAGEGSAGA